MIFLKQSLKVYISRNAIHQVSYPIGKKNDSSSTIASYTENRVLRLHKNIKLETELIEYIDQKFEELRLEMETFMETIENKFESKLMNKLKSI